MNQFHIQDKPKFKIFVESNHLHFSQSESACGVYLTINPWPEIDPNGLFPLHAQCTNLSGRVKKSTAQQYIMKPKTGGEI